MKLLRLIPLLALTASTGSAATSAAFNGGADATGTPNQFGAVPGPSISTTEGFTGGFLQITPNANDQNNYYTFNRTDTGSFARSTFSFRFRADLLGAGGADGISFNYYPTSTFGTTGGLTASPFTPEDPAAANVLGFGFDTWGNGGALDANANSADYSEISLFYNGALVQRLDDTRTLPTGAFNLKDGAWHLVNGTVDFGAANGTVSMTVDAAPIFTAVSVAGLTPRETRVGFAGRTGNANERAGIDDVNVQFVPEPVSAALLGLGGLLLLRRRRS